MIRAEGYEKFGMQWCVEDNGNDDTWLNTCTRIEWEEKDADEQVVTIKIRIFNEDENSKKESLIHTLKELVKHEHHIIDSFCNHDYNPFTVDENESGCDKSNECNDSNDTPSKLVENSESSDQHDKNNVSTHTDVDLGTKFASASYKCGDISDAMKRRFQIAPMPSVNNILSPEAIKKARDSLDSYDRIPKQENKLKKPKLEIKSIEI